MEYKIISIILQLVILFLLPPFFVGVINRVKSIFAGRKGVPILQLYYDIFKLLKKGAVYSRSTSFLFRIIPIAILAVTVCAGLLVPIGGVASVSFFGDAILFVYLFALIRFLMITSAMDVGSSFEGMGASREAIFGAFSELTIFTALISLSVVTHSLSLSGIFRGGGGTMFAEPSTILLFFSFFFILLTENSRMPIDDPNTHLELTMVHEVMILDHSGPDLGVMLYAASMKLFIFMCFAALLIYPNYGDNVWFNAASLLLKVTVVAVLVGVVESVAVRIRLIKIPQFLVAAFVVSIFALLVALFGRGML